MIIRLDRCVIDIGLGLHTFGFRVYVMQIYFLFIKSLQGGSTVDQMKRHLPRLLSFRSSKRKQPQVQTTSIDSSTPIKKSVRQLPGDLEDALCEFYDDEELTIEVPRGTPRPTIIRVGEDGDLEPSPMELESPMSISSDDDVFNMVIVLEMTGIVKTKCKQDFLTRVLI